MEETVDCPYCGEPVEVTLDDGIAGRQSLVEDCSVCCRPIALTSVVDDDGEMRVDARRLDG